MAPENFQASYHFLCVSPRLITSATALVFWFAAYKDLQSREDTRSGAWQQEGWDEVVYYTGEAKGWRTRAGDWNSVWEPRTLQDWRSLLAFFLPSRNLLLWPINIKMHFGPGGHHYATLLICHFFFSPPSSSYSAHGLQDHDPNQGLPTEVKWDAACERMPSGALF